MSRRTGICLLVVTFFMIVFLKEAELKKSSVGVLGFCHSTNKGGSCYSALFL